MTTSASSDVVDTKGNWFTRIFSSKSSRILGSSSTANRTNSVTNPGFISLSDIIKPKRTSELYSKQQQSTIDEALVDIAANAESDVSSLVDRSRGSVDFFHTPPVSKIHNK